MGLRRSLVSVLTPTIEQREWFFNRCSASVDWQTYFPAEHVIEYGPGIGPMAAFQLCLDQADGRFVMPLSDDDWLAPHAVEMLVGYMDEADVVFGRQLIVSPGNDRLVDMGCCVMWRKALSDEIGGYDLAYKHAGDTHLYARMVEHGARFAYCPEPLYFFTEHEHHHSYVHRAELEQELRQIHALYPDAVRRLQKVVS